MDSLQLGSNSERLRMASYDFDAHSSAYDYAQYPSPYDEELGEPYLIDHTSSAYCKDDYSEPINYACSYNFYEYSVNPSETSYSGPKIFQHYQVHIPSETQFPISEPEFAEYDPTPYDGGYDQTVTYGKPLPPSDLTCYPRSLPRSGTPPLDNFSYDSTPSPYGKDDPLPVKPSNGSKPTDAKIEAESRVEIAEPTCTYPSYEHQIPYGSGLEAMDICESIFGYWPCLAKKAQQHQQEINRCQLCHQDRRMDPWIAAADYFFGTPLPYDHDTHHHHHLQSPYRSDQISWLQ